jgi:nucleoid DNA-binding protein
MKIGELIAQVKAGNEKLFEGVPEKKVERIVRMTLAELSKTVAATAEGDVRLDGFGRFVVRNVERKKEGADALVRKVTFISPKPKVKAD